MSIVNELERIESVKQNIKNLITLYGTEVPNNTKIDGMSTFFTGMRGLVKPYVHNYQYGWVQAGQNFGSTATWRYQEPAGSISDIYKLISGHKYKSVLCVPGTRFRVMYCTSDPTVGTSDVMGTTITKVDNPPPSIAWTTNETPNYIFTAPSDCYLIIQKDNQYDTEIRTYVFDVTFLGNPTTPPWSE